MSQTLGILRVAPREQQVPSTVLAEGRPARGVDLPAGVVPASVRKSPPVSREDVVDDRAPSVLGFSARQAVATFARAGVLARLQGTGFVVAQDPPAGSPLRPGSVATLFLADSAESPAPEAGRRAEETAPPPSAP
jgi:hypothetical protein